jgi:2-polyprenyl-3-methyl-5-hydroxy-6-metoxy-1,4-benzoquinol methylase
MGRIDFFQCLHCGEAQAEQSGEGIACRACGVFYPVEQNIPILVRDWQRHEEELGQARAIKPGWYLEEQSQEQVSPWRHHIRKRRIYVQGALSRYLQLRERPRAATLLDLGCGDGNHMAYLQNYTDALYGSDYNLTRLVRAQLRYPEATLYLADILDYPARENFFEVVFFNHVIEHILDDRAALKAIFRMLKPGGLLILGTPNEGAWWWQLAYRLESETRRTTDHVHFYTAKSITQKIRQTGFDIIEAKHMGWGPPHWTWDGRIRRYKWVDDTFELFGKNFFPRQASSLYIVATK